MVRGSEETKESICVENMDEAIKYLEKTEGNILVTTGSKELESYTRLTDYESRVYARVLSIGQVAVNCEELGILRTSSHLYAGTVFYGNGIVPC